MVAHLGPIILIQLFLFIGIYSESHVTRKNYGEIDRIFPPRFVNDSKFSIIATSGNTAHLACEVQNIGEREVSWIRKSDFHIISIGTTKYSNDERFNVVNVSDEKNKNGWILSIQHTLPSDSGLYECQINTEPKMSRIFSLQVAVCKARILGSRQVFLQNGNDINLTCRVEGCPEAPGSVSWYANGKRVDDQLARGGISVVTETRRRSSNLVVSSVNQHDSGNYSCVSNNAWSDYVLVHVATNEIES